MGISAVAGLSNFRNYKISSIHGNPYSMNAVQRIGKDNGQTGKPLVIASEEKDKSEYVKDYGELDAPKSTASGGFAEMLSIQERMFSYGEDSGRKQYSSYLNDTIGMMGLQNRLRDQLTGAGFTPFT